MSYTGSMQKPIQSYRSCKELSGSSIKVQNARLQDADCLCKTELCIKRGSAHAGSPRKTLYCSALHVIDVNVNVCVCLQSLPAPIRVSVTESVPNT